MFIIFHCVFITNVFACDGAVSRVINSNDNPNCGDGQCWCDRQTAHCIGNKSLTTLPKIPRGVIELIAECYDLSNFNRDSLRSIRDLKLDKLRLRRNDIWNISEDVFRDFQQLTDVEISGNIRLQQDSFYLALRSLNQSNIFSLSLQENGLSIMNYEVFEEFSNLRDLALSGNKFKNLHSKGRGVLKNLKKLDMTKNRLRERRSVNLCIHGTHNSSRFPNLEMLNLSRNSLGRNGNPLLVKWKCLSKLKYLDLSNNTIGEVNITSFQVLKSLNYISFASNWINRIDVGIYPPMLESINLFDNYLVGLAPNLCYRIRNNQTFPNLKHLYFGRNYLQRVDTRWNCLPNIETLDYNKNDIRFISNNTFSHFKNLKTLQLNNLISWNKRFEPRAFTSNSLQKLDLRYNWIDFSKQQNQHLFRYCPNLTRLDVSYNNFSGMAVSSIRDILSPLTKLETLIVQHISLQRFPVEILENLTQLKVFNMDNNLLHSFELPPSFNGTMEKLEVQNISVTSCLISTVTENKFPFVYFKGLKYLDLSENPFLCDCDMEWFRDIINTTGYIGNLMLVNWPEKYLCEGPAALTGHLFEGFEPQVVCKPLNPVYIALIAIGSFLFVFTLTATAVFRNRWYIKYWWYKLGRRRHGLKNKGTERQPLLEQKQFDGYVVSNYKDNQFVHHPFRELLEDKLGYNLHIWERDAQNGALVDVMLDAIYASRKVVVIVSNNLIKDSWCKFQVDVAIDRNIELRDKSLLLVVLDDVDFTPVSKSWCVLLTKMPTAHWSNETNSNKQKLFEETVMKHFGLKTIN